MKHIKVTQQTYPQIKWITLVQNNISCRVGYASRANKLSLRWPLPWSYFLPMLSYSSKRLNQPLDPPARALPLPSPVTGQITPLPAEYPGFIQQGLFGQGVGVLLTKGDIVCPFAGHIYQQNPSDYSLQFHANNGLRLYIKFAASVVPLMGEQLRWHRRSLAPCNPGDKLATINPMWLKSQQIMPLAFVGVLNMQKVQGFYPSPLRTLNAFRDNLMTLYF